MTWKQWLITLLRRIFLPRSTRTMEWHMLKLLNRDRKRHGLPGLFMQEDLRAVARKHSRDMAKKDYFSHTNLRGKSPGDRLRDARVTDAISGENLAKIAGFALPTMRAEIGLMNSPGHRANILNTSYNCVGIGVVKSWNRIYYFTQNFAKRDLIFRFNPPTKTRLKKGIQLKGKTARTLKQIIVEIEQQGKEKQFHTIPVYKNRFKTQLTFPETGHFSIRVYTPHGKTHHLANHFEVQVGGKRWPFSA